MARACIEYSPHRNACQICPATGSPLRRSNRRASNSAFPRNETGQAFADPPLPRLLHIYSEVCCTVMGFDTSAGTGGSASFSSPLDLVALMASMAAAASRYSMHAAILSASRDFAAVSKLAPCSPAASRASSIVSEANPKVTIAALVPREEHGLSCATGCSSIVDPVEPLTKRPHQA
jgi:hypothetical protein